MQGVPDAAQRERMHERSSCPGRVREDLLVRTHESRDPGATSTGRVCGPWAPDLPPGQARGRLGHASFV